jgi:hypothetical protein
MRHLTREELELVAGGTETVTVTADPYPYGGDGGGSPGDGSGDGGGSNTGGGDVGQPTFDDQGCAINAIKTQIALSPDHTHAEHMAIVYHDQTGIHTSPIFVGNGSQAPTPQVVAWMEANGISFSQVTDLYHNHDPDQYATNPVEAAVNRYPSGVVNGNDWTVADEFVHPIDGSAGADPNNFTMTLEDTSGVVRDFAYSQENYYKSLSVGQMIGTVGLPDPDPAC